MNEMEQLLFEIISYCGSARSFYLESVNAAKNESFKEAIQLYNDGEDVYELGHQAHLKLLTKFQVNDMLLLTIHAEDQLMSAENFKIVCREFINLYGLNLDVALHNLLLLLLGLEFTALGTVFLKIGNLGMNSLSTLPAAICAIFPMLTFGTANLLTMIVSIIILMLLTHKIKAEYFLCFISSIIYSIFLDLTVICIPWQTNHLVSRILLFVFGMLLVSLGIYFQKETALPSTPFNLVCKELAIFKQKSFTDLKAGLDISFVSITLILEVFTKNYEIVGIGTVICALFVSRLIKLYQAAAVFINSRNYLHSAL
ncbi:DUF6198 family protein [Dielma fastidiosa]|uniref:DUF6198 family protein n=1 Tax=Dielma fastidiosa TaxID=1034346 RepID=A0AB35UQI2_9FIRM|nr:DUF6198 family protein [Dielma fastidiosa]MDY5168899.1 DUF6198 family protein [Dielma fastidiosa]